MEINITRLFNRHNPRAYSASVAELGADAGRVTWSAACEESPMLLNTRDKREAFIDHALGYGAWSEEELRAMSRRELNALLVQMIAGDMRDYCDDVSAWNWSEYEKGCKEGRYSGRIGRGVEPGTVWYCLGS